MSTSGRILVLGDLYLEKDYGRHAGVSLTRGVHARRMCDAEMLSHERQGYLGVGIDRRQVDLGSGLTGHAGGLVCLKGIHYSL